MLSNKASQSGAGVESEEFGLVDQSQQSGLADQSEQSVSDRGWKEVLQHSRCEKGKPFLNIKACNMF